MIRISRQNNLKRAVAVLSRLASFRDFSEVELTGLFDSSLYEIKRFGKGEIIHLQNEICQYLEIILEGKVIVQNIDMNGNVLTIDTFIGGDMIGANLLFSNKNVYPMTVTASADTTIIRLSRELTLALCRKSTNFMLGFFQVISDKTIIMTEKLNTISRKTIRQCIFDFLKSERYRQGSDVIKLALSKKELAERLGVPRSSLGRELGKMRKEGLVEFDAWTITIKE